MPLVYCYCASVASIHTNPTTTWCISRVLPGLSSAASSIALLALHVHVYASLPDSDMLTYGRLLQARRLVARWGGSGNNEGGTN